MNPNSPVYTHCLRALGSSDLFTGLEENLLRDMLRLFRYETVASRQVFPLGDVFDRFHVLVSGRLRLSRANSRTGRAVTLFLLRPGDGFDVISLLDGQPHALEAKALDELELLIVPAETVRTWIEHIPELNRNFLPYLGKQLRTLADLAADLALRSTETRLAKLIIRSAVRDQSEASLHLIKDLPHETLAEMIGTVRVVVNRQLQHWKREGVITMHHGHLVVEELHVLAEKCDEHLADLDSTDHHGR